MIADNTPVIIGVGQHSERVGEPGYAALSHMDLAGRALAAAIADCGASGDVASAIDTIAAIRQFEISYPQAVAPFGKSDNPPRSIGKRAGADPRRAILEVVGGQGPQKLVGEFASDIALGECELAAIVGAEAISTVRALLQQGVTPDWSEAVAGQLEDRGLGMERLQESEMLNHGAGTPIPGYAILENARRARLGLSLEAYRLKIGELFAPFTRVAAANPHAASREVHTAEGLARITERNRVVSEPYGRLTVARDQVNQAAAILIASARKARELGVPESKWVHIHAVTAAQELASLERPDLSRSAAAHASLDSALDRAGKSVAEIGYFDFYSCFAIPVFNAIDHLGVAPDDPRGLTLTGGLPFFGGAGNDYSGHAIAEAVQRARGDRGAFALIGANGGIMGKYATGIYSTEPVDWQGADRYLVLPDATGAVAIARHAPKSAKLETYTIHMHRDGPVAIFIGRNGHGERVCGNADLTHEPTAKLFEGGEPFGAQLAVMQDKRGRNIARLA